MKKQQLVIHIPADLKDWLRDQAQQDDRSVSYIVEALLQKARKASQQEEASP